jgi:Cadherin domain
MKKISFFCAFSASPVQYKITSGNAGGAFGIHNSTGLLFIACALDYEKIKKVSSAEGFQFSGRLKKTNMIFYFVKQYELRITASDNFKENYTTVVINIR